MKNKIKNLLIISSLAFWVLLVMNSCGDIPEYIPKGADQLVISEFVSDNDDPAYKDRFKEFAGILDTTNLKSLLSVRGPFTLFLPSDSVMKIYYQELGVSSYLDLDVATLKELAMNHIVPIKVSSSDFGLGAIREPNSLGDFIVTEFEGSDIILNKYSWIVDRDIDCANGVVHEIDHVLKPITRSVYERLADDPSYSLFTKGLELTGIKDTLNVIGIPFGDTMARTRYTILAVADTTFNRYGINDIDDFISYFTSNPDSIIYKENPFYRYMEYHCLTETYYLNELENVATSYPVLSFENIVNIRVDDDYKINFDKLNDSYTGFYIDASNQPAKNGAIHTINDLLPVIEAERATIRFETTDYFDMRLGDYYGKYYSRWFDGQNTFEYIKWEGDYLLYYFKDHDTGFLINDDCLSMSGWWWVQITTPKIMKGKYNITSNLWSGNINYAVYIDGVNTANISSSDPAMTTSWGTPNWTETERHTIKVVAKSPGMLFWDFVDFEPIK